MLTRRIAWRIASGDAASTHVLALTFTRKAAGELRGRLRHLGVIDQVTAATFHAVALAQLRRLAADRGLQPPAVLSSKVRLVGRVMGDAGANGPASRRHAGNRTTFSGRPPAADVAAEIEWAKARLVTPDRYEAAAAEAGRRPPMSLAEIADFFSRYEVELRRQRMLDFEDLLTHLARLIAEDPDVAAAQRWRFRHLFVDEFQDVNLAQLALLEGWLGDRRDLCVVGDPAQAIYGWNGADPRVMTSVEERWPGITVIALSSNYRSTPQIVEVARAAIGRAAAPPARPRPGGGTLFDSAAPVISFHPTPTAVRSDGPIPDVIRYASDRDEVLGVVSAVRRAHRPGRAWSQIAVLARTNAQLTLLAEGCRAARVPHRSLDNVPFGERPGVRRALSTLPANGDSARLSAWLADLEQPADPLRASDPERDALAAAEAGLDLAILAQLGREYSALDPSGGTAGFTAWLRQALAAEPAPSQSDVVELATFHRAKGLEWPVVFVTGLENGLVPIGQGGDGERLAEERRLLYVALTRAEDELHCSWSATRTFGTRSLAREPSPWLAAIEAARQTLLGLSPRARPPRDGYRSVRAMLREGTTSPDAGALTKALVSWRARAARAADVPAYVILPNKTLEAIVARRPRTRTELLAIPGLGPMRVDSYGATIFELVREHSEG